MSYDHQDLTSWERRMLDLADMPGPLRDQIISGVQPDPFPLYSLNNETGSAPTSGIKENGASGVCPIRKEVHGPCSLLLRESSDWSQAQKRSTMLSYMREWFPGFDWSRNLWTFIELYKQAALEVFDIRDDIYRPYRVHNFRSCYWKDAHGWTYTNKINTEDVYRQRYRCQEPGCLDCRDMTRGKLALEWLDVWKKIVDHHPGCPGFLEVVFTLPAELESLPLEYPERGKDLQDGVHGIIRKMLGVGTLHGARSNVLCHFSVHPVGDKDLFRDRYHLHVDVLPCHVVKTKDGIRSLKWIHPARTAQSHRSEDWKIDLNWLREEYNALLTQVFGDAVSGAICPQVAFISYSDASTRYRKCRDRKDHVFWGIAAHKLKYSMRGFGRDIEKAVLRSDSATELCIMRSQRDGFIQWQVAPVRAVSERFKWIRENNRCHTRGFGRRLKEYENALGFEVQQPVELPEVVRADAKVKIVREKRYDKKSGKVKWVRDERYSWMCPITGKDMEKGKSDLKSWKKGR